MCRDGWRGILCCMFLLLRQIRSPRLRIAAVVAVLLAVVVIDLLFSAHPALSIGIEALVVALGVTVRLLIHGRASPRGSDKRH
jgi:hypothetical protein